MATEKTPKIGSVRTTSNGCTVARRVPRTATSYRQPSPNIAAIDFGTANCSLAYIIAGELTDSGPNLLSLHGTVSRVPTAILFRKDGTVKAFGETARKSYRNLDGEERLDWAYFEQIKMDLQQDESVNREMKVKAKNGKEYYLVEVIAHILKYLKDELIKKLKRAEYHLEATDFDWVITVPAIWRARGKQMMREAGYKAGLCSQESCMTLQPASHSPEPPNVKHPEKLSLALEPESAAIFCQTMSRKQLAQHCQANEPFTASSYLIVDIGGGTVDISDYHVVEGAETYIQVLHPPTGNDCGGTRVNKEFQGFLQTLVDDEGFKRFLCTGDECVDAKNQAYLNELLNENFEKQKTLFGDKDDSAGDGQLSIELPYEFLETYHSDLKEGIKSVGGPQAKLVGQDLRISYELMAKFFEPIRDGILECIAQTLEDVEEKVEKIYLVGGFGGCKYLFRAIEETFGTKYRYIVPCEPAYAVVRGAVLSRLYPDMIKCRKVDATYGIASCIPFSSHLHDLEYRWRDDDGDYLCNNIFSTIVQRGDIVNSGDVFKQTYYPTYHNQTKMAIEFHCSMEKDVWYVTGRRGRGSRIMEPAKVNKIGEIRVIMPVLHGDKSRAVDVTFDFSHTEIQVQAFDRTSKNEVTTVLDFLTS